MFVSLEGIDGAGKSTQVELLRTRLVADGRDVVATRDPGGTELGARLRDVVLAGPRISAWAEMAIFAAARAELVARVIVPALLRGADVICDRYVDSSIAYQGAGRELGSRRILEFNLPTTLGLIPDRTFLLAVDPAVAKRRAGGWLDWIGREDHALRNRVISEYGEVARRFPDRVVTVDASRPATEVADQIYERVRELYGKTTTAHPPPG